MNEFAAKIQAIIHPNSQQEYEEATKALVFCREQNLQFFLELIFSSFDFFHHESIQVDMLLLILACQSIRVSNIQIIQELSNFNVIFIQQMLNQSVFFFFSNNQSLQSNSAAIFSHLLCIDNRLNNKFSIISAFLTLLQNHLVETIYPISLVIRDFYEICHIDESITSQIYILISQLFEFPIGAIHLHVILILSTIIGSIAFIINDQKEFERIISYLLKCLQCKEIQSEALSCLSLIVEQYYPRIEAIIPLIVSPQLLTIVNNESSEELLITFCEFWNTIAQYENECEQSFNIIDNICINLIPVLFEIASSSKKLKSDDSDEYSPQTMATIALKNVILKCPWKCQELLESLIGSFCNSPEGGKREASLSLASFLISFYQLPNEKLAAVLGVADRGLMDPFPRVRQNAVYLVDSIADRIGLDERVLHLIQIVLSKLGNDPEIAEDVIRVVGNFFSLELFPYSEPSISSLLNIAINSDMFIATITFSSLSQAACIDNDLILQKFLEQLIQILSTCELNEWMLSQFSHLVAQVLYKLNGKIHLQFEMLCQFFMVKFGFHLAVLPIAALMRSCPNIEFLPQVIELILKGMHTEHFADSSEGIKIIAPLYDLTPFSSLLLESLRNILVKTDIPISYKQYTIEALELILRLIPSAFDFFNQNMIGCLTIIEQSLYDWEEFDVIASYLRLLNRCIPSNPNFICSLMFNVLKLVSLCQCINNYLFEEILNSIESLYKIFPNELKTFLDNNKSFQNVLSIGMHLDDIDCAKVEFVLNLL